MGRKKKDDRQVKKQVTIFITDEELFRIKQMAQTWGTNVSQMAAHLINQAYSTGAYLNGYDKLTQDERADLVARRAYSNFLTARRSEAARIRNFDRRNGLDRGLTNVMVIAAPEDMTGFKGNGFPGIFCKNLGDVWIVPYGLLNRVSVVELIEYPCFASVFDYFAGNAIPPSSLSDFIEDKRDYVLFSFGEKAVLKRLFELYGHLRFPNMRQAKNIVREQRDELSNRISQYQTLLNKLKQVRQQKVAQARAIVKLQEQGHSFPAGAVNAREFVPTTDMQDIDWDEVEKSRPLTPQESLEALQNMMPDGAQLDPKTLERLKTFANAPREPNEEYFAYLRDQIDQLYQGLDVFYDQKGRLEAYKMLEDAKSANTYYDQILADSDKDNAFVFCDLKVEPTGKIDSPVSLDDFLEANPDLEGSIDINSDTAVPEDENSAIVDPNAPRKPGRPPKKKVKPRRVALPKYLSSTASDMANRFKQNSSEIEQNSSDYVSPMVKEEKPIPLPEVYDANPSDERFMPELNLNEFSINPKKDEPKS